mmetsp:Transcript_2810/g.8577  ORF Transcript_2810/g.8577 Transcript_2810/m.8577 type:complete len:367 (+) Transcript_2810:107-1207(+)
MVHEVEFSVVMRLYNNAVKLWLLIDHLGCCIGLAERVVNSKVVLVELLRLNRVIWVCTTTVLGNIITKDFIFWRNPENAKDLHQDEEWSNETTGPRSNGDDGNAVGSQKSSASAPSAWVFVESARMNDFTIVVGTHASLSLSPWRDEQANGKGSPGTTGAVDGERLQWIVNLQFEEKPGSAHVDKGSNETDCDGRIRLYAKAASCDRHQTSKSSVEHGKEIIDMILKLHDDESCQASGGSGKCGVHGAASDGVGISIASCAELRSRVEPIPAEPEDKSSQGAERGRVSWHWNNVALRVEATHSRTDDCCAHQTSEASDHMHDGAAGKVDDANLKETTQPAASPHPVGDHGVDKRRQEESISEICVE